MNITQIVDVNILLGSQTVNVPGFGVGLILSPILSFGDRARVYDSFTAVEADLTNVGDAALLAAAGLYFSQAQSPTSLVLGAIQGMETPVQALAAVQAVNDNWYALACVDQTPAHVEALAAVIEPQAKIFITSSSDATIGSAGTTDIAYIMKALGYKRTSVLYSASAASFPECAWLGAVLPLGVGNSIWKFKQLVGIASDNLSDTFIGFATGKNANVYVPTSGVDITINGNMVGGQKMDITRGVDALQANIEADTLQLLVDQPKVPYTNKGINQIENVLRGVLQEFVDNGFLANYSVSAPDVNAISQSDKRARVLNGLAFSAELAGAIEKITINGFLSF